MEQEYYLGLDMGTGSVGWAVTDSEYHVLRKHGKRENLHGLYGKVMKRYIHGILKM